MLLTELHVLHMSVRADSLTGVNRFGAGEVAMPVNGADGEKRVDVAEFGTTVKSVRNDSSYRQNPLTLTRLPQKREKPNAKVTNTFPNGIVPARSRPYHVGNENGGDTVARALWLRRRTKTMAATSF